MRILKRFWLMLPALLIAVTAMAQVTGGAVTGTVKDSKGQVLAGAAVEVLHEPSGTKYKTVSVSSGKFNVPALRVGGPYKITISYVGMKTETLTDVYIQLGEPSVVDVTLAETSAQLAEVVVSGASRRGALISKDRKGTSTNVNRRLLSSLPTLSRSITDFTKLTPQANGTSFAGQDNRAINFTLDGSIFNNSFGLSALNGGQTNSTPISLDAIEEIQINLTPYNLRESGFIGANINAVTKSGTNIIHGGGFYNKRNEGLVGTKAGAAGKQDVLTTAFDVKQYGVSLGGPIIKNKLFYFINYEAERRTDPGTTFVPDNGTNTGGGNVTRVLESDLIDVSNYLQTKLNYSTGAFKDYSFKIKSDKALAKIDWNINDKHKFSVRGNYLKSTRDIGINSTGVVSGTRSSGINSMAYENAAYEQNNNLYSVIGQLNSRFSSKVSNEVIFGYTRNDDYRAVKGGLFPTVDIQKGGTTYISFGNDANTVNNGLFTDTWQFSDNVTIYKGKHTISTGLSYESFSYLNGFTPRVNGIYTFSSIADFKTAVDAYVANPNLTTSPVTMPGYSANYSNLPGGDPWLVRTKARSYGVYIQDDVEVEKNFNLTYGVRFEVPYFVGSGYTNTEVDGFNFVNEKGEPTKLSTSKLPSTKLLINPRIGFNYDINSDKKTQVRGGVGLFTGRPQFVLISNQVGNNGVLNGGVSILGATTQYPFTPVTPAKPLIPQVPGTPAPTYSIVTTQEDFKFPQVLRANFGVDQKIYKDIVASGEVTFTQGLNAIFYYNANLVPATANFTGPDNRPRFAGVPILNASATSNGTTVSGATINNAIRINPKISDAIVMKSAPHGTVLTTTIKIEKPTKASGLGWMIAYNFSSAKNYTDYSTTANGSGGNWDLNKTINGNNRPDIAFNDNDLRNRVLGNINYRIEFSKFAALQLSVFGETKNQGRVSYTYSGDMNGDGSSGNDLIYIPRDQSEMNFQQYAVGTTTYTVADQKNAFEAFIQQDSYLNGRRGKYAERNGKLLPYVSRFDVSAMLELFRNVGKQRHTIQIRADIFNFGNMLNPSSGVGYNVNQSSPLIARGVDANGQPIFRVNTVNNSLTYTSTRKGTGLADVWQAQLGVRYIF